MRGIERQGKAVLAGSGGQNTDRRSAVEIHRVREAVWLDVDGDRHDAVDRRSRGCRVVGQIGIDVRGPGQRDRIRDRKSLRSRRPARYRERLVERDLVDPDGGPGTDAARRRHGVERGVRSSRIVLGLAECDPDRSAAAPVDELDPANDRLHQRPGLGGRVVGHLTAACGLHLALHHRSHGLAQALGVRLLVVGLLVLLGADKRQQLWRADQAADVGGEDLFLVGHCRMMHQSPYGTIPTVATANTGGDLVSTWTLKQRRACRGPVTS